MKHIDIPKNNYENDYEFIYLSKQCRKGNTEAMLAMSDYFEALYKKYKERFYRLAANFWHYFAFKRGNPMAKEWFNMWLKENPGVPFYLLYQSLFVEILKGVYFVH